MRSPPSGVSPMSPHVLNGCMKHPDAIQRRHNAICNWLETAIRNMRGFKGVVRKDNAVPGCESRRTLRPDIVWIDEAAKTVKIVDVAVTSKNRKPPGQHHRRPPGRRGPGNHDRTGASTTAPPRCYEVEIYARYGDNSCLRSAGIPQ